jgi:hypothetical protein
MDAFSLLAYVALGTGAGLLIGCVGIGGVIVAPALVYVAGVAPRTAIATALCAFAVSGTIGLYAYAKAGSIRWRDAAFASLGALPCAFGGALLGNAVQPVWLELTVALLMMATGLYTLVRRHDAPGIGRPLSAASLTGIGAGTGLLSALTGTGGPLVLVPILLWLEVPVLAAIGLGQAIQLPVAAAATAGNLLAGALDLRLSLALAVGLSLGTGLGAKAAHALPTSALRKAVASLLVVLGAAILLRIAQTPAAT